MRPEFAGPNVNTKAKQMSRVEMGKVKTKKLQDKCSKRVWQGRNNVIDQMVPVVAVTGFTPVRQCAMPLRRVDVCGERAVFGVALP
jgi:hypothetical protein